LNILITNDDGIHAAGLYHLKQALEKIAVVLVVAPDTEQSAVGHAITISDPLRVYPVEKDNLFFGYAVNGTPADCVKLGVKCLMETKADLVVSGINSGPNTGTNIIYSGTVSAAAEAVIMGIPGLALSITSFHVQDYEFACTLAVDLARQIYTHGLRAGTLLNVNIPPLKSSEIAGIMVTRQGQARFEEYFDKRVDPTNRVYYWLAGKRLDLDKEEDLDDVAIQQNKVSITPIRYDLTDMAMLAELKKWGIER
jgi:5'-nucleotidase